MALDEEKRADLEDAVAEMRLLDEMVKTAGWTKIMLPLFSSLKDQFLGDLLEAKEINPVYKAQAGIWSIAMITSEVTRRIQEGVDAVETLSKDKEPDESEEDKE